MGLEVRSHRGLGWGGAPCWSLCIGDKIAELFRLIERQSFLMLKIPLICKPHPSMVTNHDCNHACFELIYHIQFTVLLSYCTSAKDSWPKKKIKSMLKYNCMWFEGEGAQSIICTGLTGHIYTTGVDQYNTIILQLLVMPGVGRRSPDTTKRGSKSWLNKINHKNLQWDQGGKRQNEKINCMPPQTPKCLYPCWATKNVRPQTLWTN